MLNNICIAIACSPGCDVMSFEINISFLSTILRKKWNIFYKSKFKTDKNKLRSIQNPVKHLRCSVLQNLFTAFSC